MMTSVFKVANCFHPIHLQLETLTDNFDKQFESLLTKLDYYDKGSILIGPLNNT